MTEERAPASGAVEFALAAGATTVGTVTCALVLLLGGKIIGALPNVSNTVTIAAAVVLVVILGLLGRIISLQRDRRVALSGLRKITRIAEAADARMDQREDRPKR